VDPLTHTLVGATMARTRLGRGVPYASATLVLAANAPDVDVLAYFGGEDAGFLWRRGWSHGPLGMLVLPLVLVLALGAWWRWRSGRTPAPWRKWLALAYLGTLTHPALDWLNTYGVRLLSPFSTTWYYGDTLFIVDPWLWLLLGGGMFLASSPSRRAVARWAALALVASLAVLAGPVGAISKALWVVGLVLLAAWRARAPEPLARRGDRIATCAAGAAALYLGVMLAGAGAARSLVAAELQQRGLGRVESLMVGPLPATLLRREVVVELPDRYVFGTFRWLGSPRLVLELGEAQSAQKPASAVSLAALEDPAIRGFACWARYPYVELERLASGVTRAWIFDARYVRPPAPRGRGFGVAFVDVEPAP
jgi:inner membrane protein